MITIRHNNKFTSKGNMAIISWSFSNGRSGKPIIFQHTGVDWEDERDETFNLHPNDVCDMYGFRYKLKYGKLNVTYRGNLNYIPITKAWCNKNTDITHNLSDEEVVEYLKVFGGLHEEGHDSVGSILTTLFLGVAVISLIKWIVT